MTELLKVAQAADRYGRLLREVEQAKGDLKTAVRAAYELGYSTREIGVAAGFSHVSVYKWAIRQD